VPYLSFICLFLLCVSTTIHAHEHLMIRSAVATDFPDGLHSKYLTYIANALEMPLQITPMSFSRRLRALRQGELDILVGLQDKHLQQEGLIFIRPAYQILASTFFVRHDELARLSQYQDLGSMRIAVTPKVSYFSEFDQDRQLAKVAVDSLQQKIKLLVNGRVDTFIHNKDSTIVSLKIMGLTQQVTAANYQPDDKRKYYFAIGVRSALHPYLKRLKQVIQQGITSGTFAEIRRLHYLQLASKTKGQGNINRVTRP